MIGTKIKTVREGKKIPQSELAKLTGLKQCQISKIENGSRKITAEELQVIAAALNVDIGKLI